MKRRLLLLVAACVAVGLLLAYPAFWLGGPAGLWQCAVAGVLCLIPAIGTFIWCEWAYGRSPELQLAAVMGGTGIRLFFVVGAALLLYYSLPEFHNAAFWIWVVVFYLATLGLEVILLVRGATHVGTGSPPRHSA